MSYVDQHSTGITSSIWCICKAKSNFLEKIMEIYVHPFNLCTFMDSFTITDYRVRELNIFQAEEFAEMDIR